MVDRAELGAEKFGVPAFTVITAVRDVLDTEPWTSINKDAVEYYIEKVPMEWLPELADFQMTDEQLAALDPDHVRDAVYLLTRDMFHQNREHLQPEGATDWPEDWVETLFEQIAGGAGLDVNSYADWQHPFSLQNPFDRDAIGWAVRIAGPFFAEPEKLALCHEAIVEGVIEDVLDPDGNADDDEEWDLDDDEL